MKCEKIKMLLSLTFSTWLLSMMLSCGKSTSAEPKTPDEVVETPVDTPVVVPETPEEPGEVDTSGVVTRPTGVSFQKVNDAKSGVTDYVLQLPASYNKDKRKKWPMIIFLHGIGEIGNNLNVVKNVGLAKKAAADPDFPYVVISPQCRSGWWENPSLDALYADVIKLYNVDTNRIYLTGLSMGGYGAWDWAQNSPSKFAALVPICGGGTPSNACVLKDMPVWAFHNSDDGTVSVWNSRDMVEAIKKCGGEKIKYTENETGGHDAWTKAYNNADLYTWLNEQKKP